MAQIVMRGRLPLEGPLALTVEAFMPIPTSWSQRQQRKAVAGVVLPTTKPDFDNILKSLDALNKVVWRDDAQVVDVRFTKRYGDKPRLVVVVDPISEAVQ